MTERDIKTGDIFISRFTFQTWSSARHIRVKTSDNSIKNLKELIINIPSNKIAKRARVK